MQSEKRNFEIDVLRGFAILLVLFRHSHYALPTFITKYPVVLQGTWSGVDLFFVISGFVITLSLLPLIEASRRGLYSTGQVLKSFFARRVLRLLPLSLFALTLNVALCLVWNRSGQFGPWQEVRNEILPILLNYYNYYEWLGGTGQMSWYWSLSIEEQFYALYPFVLLAIPSRRAKTWGFLAVIAAITLVLRPLTTPDFESVKFKLWPLFTTPSHLRFDCILAGCVAGLLYTDHRDRIVNWVVSNIARARVTAAAALFGVATAGILLPRFELTGYPAILLCSTILVLIAAASAGATPFFGAGRALNWIGRRSYAIYLIHMIAIHTVNEGWFRLLGKSKNELSWSQGMVGLAIALLGTGLLVEALYGWIERRGIEAGRGISKRVLSDQPGSIIDVPATVPGLVTAVVAGNEARKPIAG